MSNKLILIVDDEPTGRQLLQAMLMNSGYDIVLAESGSKAIELLKTTNPSLILLDIMMPEISGFDVITKIKKDEETKDIPIMRVSALDDRDNRIKGLELGAVDYISKPFDRIEILTKINNHIAKRELKQQDSNKKSNNNKLNTLIDEIKHTIQTELKPTLNLEALYVNDEKINTIGSWSLPYNKGICNIYLGSENQEEEDAYQFALISVWLSALKNSQKNKEEINQFIIDKLTTNKVFTEKQWWYTCLFYEEKNKYYITGLNADALCLTQTNKNETSQINNIHTPLIENTFFNIDECSKLLIHIGKNPNLTKPEKRNEIAILIHEHKTEELKVLLKELEGNPHHVTSYLVNMG